MGNCVTVSEKKEFIQWFLNSHELQKREAAWLLNYLCSDDDALRRTHFVDNLRNLPKTMIVSARCVSMTPFQYSKKKRVTSDVETAFYDIRSGCSEDLYISLHFKEKTSCPEYAAVLEVNPMERQDLVHDSLCSLFAEIILDQAVRDYRKKELYRRIDDALANGDEQEFLQLTEQWLKIVENK
ncbi:ReoY family proteolytic degradation factor [Desmospora profundinema]|uniref:Uncharacterized protein YpiB (UPF0302 family) n=1 Tax=Desmospora profundinema TaxID=1571184 RepID=A0ABU1II86_9BACL|nr:ReoY family proteolytic degradation factor [Desmospora profundinema]MDR6224487.1 uncharacterized protein YpiB (UPF0302 family) [Desmospora profundinema]